MQTLEFDPDAPLLEIDDLSIQYETRSKGAIRAVDGLSFEIGTNEIFGLVGESGCGKSTIAKSILGLLPRNGSVVDGEIRFKGVDLTELSTMELNQIRWSNISMISQGAMNALNPVMRISNQILEAIRSGQQNVSTEDARETVRELFELVGLDPERIDEYPHQFSGGMKQRAFIAMALAQDPDLLIADEPTTALDVIVQDQILKRLLELQDDFDLSIILITHDISVVAETCESLGVMYSGKLMEYGNLKSIFSEPYNPYTLGLQNAFPSLSGEKTELIEIPGSPPDLSELHTGCRFVERCPFAEGICFEKHPPLEEVKPGHFSACYRHDIIEHMRERATAKETWHDDETQSMGAGD